MSSIDVSKIKLFQLRAFVAVADSGNFGKAAIQLGLTQSSISHAIASLEAELGVVLFFRGRQGAILTFVGEQIINHVRQMLQILDTVAEKAIASRSLETGRVRIAAIRSLATHWLPSVLAIFNQQFPQVIVTVRKCFDYVEVQTALYQHAADIGLADLYEQDEYNIVEIGVDEYVLLLPSSLTLPNGAITWQYIQSFPLIMPAANDQGYAELRQYVSELDVPLIIAYEINEDSAIVSMVAQGLGIAILPYLAALPIPATVQIHRLPRPLTRLLCAIIREDALHSPVIFRFLDIVKQVKGGDLQSAYFHD